MATMMKVVTILVPAVLQLLSIPAVIFAFVRYGPGWEWLGICGAAYFGGPSPSPFRSLGRRCCSPHPTAAASASHHASSHPRVRSLRSNLLVSNHLPFHANPYLTPLLPTAYFPHPAPLHPLLLCAGVAAGTFGAFVGGSFNNSRKVGSGAEGYLVFITAPVCVVASFVVIAGCAALGMSPGATLRYCATIDAMLALALAALVASRSRAS